MKCIACELCIILCNQWIVHASASAQPTENFDTLTVLSHSCSFSSSLVFNNFPLVQLFVNQHPFCGFVLETFNYATGNHWNFDHPKTTTSARSSVFVAYVVDVVLMLPITTTSGLRIRIANLFFKLLTCVLYIIRVVTDLDPTFAHW